MRKSTAYPYNDTQSLPLRSIDCYCKILDNRFDAVFVSGTCRQFRASVKPHLTTREYPIGHKNAPEHFQGLRTHAPCDTHMHTILR